LKRALAAADSDPDEAMVWLLTHPNEWGSAQGEDAADNDAGSEPLRFFNGSPGGSEGSLGLGTGGDDSPDAQSGGRRRDGSSGSNGGNDEDDASRVPSGEPTRGSLDAQPLRPVRLSGDHDDTPSPARHPATVPMRSRVVGGLEICLENRLEARLEARASSTTASDTAVRRSSPGDTDAVDESADLEARDHRAALKPKVLGPHPPSSLSHGLRSCSRSPSNRASCFFLFSNSRIL
jgi:hypothetical protein